MSSFQEIQQKLEAARQRKSILEYLISQLESEFLSSDSRAAKKKLLTTEKKEVLPQSFELEISFFMSDIQELEQEIASILAMEVSLTKPTPDAKKSKNSNIAQGEA